MSTKSPRHTDTRSKLDSFALNFESNRTIPEERARTKQRAIEE